MVKITVIQCTRRRLPHLEWALESLKKQTFKDFEYIVVDGLYDTRKDNMLKLIKDSGISFPVLYLKDKASRWKGKRPALSNARNTGLLFANGQWIVFHDDNCKMDLRWLERHVEWLEKGYVVAGSWIGPASDYRTSIMKDGGEISGGWLYGTNMGFPLEALLSINCFDEILDGEMGQDDIHTGIRLERKGYKIIYDPRCLVNCDYTDHGSFHFYLSSRSEKKEIGYDIPPVEKKLKDGKLHYSNEYEIQCLLEDKDRWWTKGNTINIAGTRELLGTGNGWNKWKYSLEKIYEMLESFVDGNLIDWRDGKLISDKIGV